MCKISIIMPVYNKVEYIEKAIKSIQDQTFSEWELLVIDDGSTDGSAEKCDVYQGDKRIKIFHTQNGGVSKARNFGLQRAVGEYVTFIDGDDYVEKDFLEGLYIPKKEMIIAGLKKVDHQGNCLKEVTPFLCGEYSVEKMARQFYTEQKETGIYGYVAGKLVRRSVIEENQIVFDENIKLAEDYDFYLKIYSVIKKICFLNQASYCYVQETLNSAVALDDEKIDFFIQIEIQKRTRSFLEKYRCFGIKENQIFLHSITGYLYTILLMNRCRTYQEFCQLYERLKKAVPEVEENLNGFQKLCMNLYKDKKIRSLYTVLKMRLFVRKR